MGATLPVLLLAFYGVVGCRVRQILLFFVGFCLFANGAYIGGGVLAGAGDCRQLVRYGSPVWLLVAFGIASSAGGLFAWHRMGPPGRWFAEEARNGIDHPHARDSE